MTRFVAAITILLLCSVHLAAQKYSNEFLSIGLGARALGMGGACASGVNDATAGYWNPAALPGLTATDRLLAGAMHAEWFAGIGKYDYLGAAGRIDDAGRSLGISLIRFGIDNIPNTLSLYEEDGTVNYDNIVEFSAADYALLLSYGQPIAVQKGELTIGGNVKIIHRSIGSFAQSWGFGLDAAARYETGNWRFALVGRDLTTTFNAWTFGLTESEARTLELTNNELPINSVEITRPTLIIGAGWKREWENTNSLEVEGNVFVTTDGPRNTLISGDPLSMSPAVGLEYGFRKKVYVRAGAGNFQEEVDFDRTQLSFRPSMGVGLQIGSVRVDYAFTDIGRVREERYSHVVSLHADLSIKPRKQD